MSTIKGLSINRENKKLDVQLDSRMFNRDSEGVISLVGMEAFHAYGVEWDTEVADPDCTRIGNMDLHRTLPVQSAMRGCLLDDNGNVVMYLPTNDWTSSVRDGSMGQVMVEIPRHYRKCVTNGTKRQVWLSVYPIDGYHEVPKMYVGAYEASLQRSTNKLCSVVNGGVDYRGGNNNPDYDNSIKTLLLKATTNLSRTQFRQAARNRNQTTTEWNCYTYDCHKALYWLFTVEYATLNCQLDYNTQLTSEGFHQGGLSEGLTNIDSIKWLEWNGYCPLIDIGETDSAGNNTTVIYRQLATGLSPTGSSMWTHIPRYRGIEHPFGHLWKWTDGINIAINPATDSYPYSEVLICSDPSKFSDKREAYYDFVGFEARANGYGITHIFGAGGEMIPSAVGGSSTTYLCDYHYTDIPSSAKIQGVLFGGAAIRGSLAGFACAYSHYVPSYASSDVGSRLCFIPR